MIYKYKCNTCNEEFLLIRKVVERDLPAMCPKCNCTNCTRLFNDAIQLDGNYDGSFRKGIYLEGYNLDLYASEYNRKGAL